MNILITGGFGYVGGQLARYLYDHNHTIYLGTRYDRDVPDWLPQSRVVRMKWDSQDELNNVCHQIDVVIHTAGMNASDCTRDPVAALEVNGVSTERLLQAAIQKKVSRFIYLSTAHVYRTPLAGIISEETPTVNRHPYATSHLVGERAVLSAHQCGAIDGVVIRLSNAFGAPMQERTDCWTLLVNDLCRQVVTTQQMRLYSTGLQRRDFVSLTDVCGAVDFLLQTSRRDLNIGLFNLGGNWSPTVWEMACFIQSRCEAVLNFKPNLYRVLPQADCISNHLEYKIDRLLRMGFKPARNRTVEIDQLLTFCQSVFCKKQNTSLPD